MKSVFVALEFLKISPLVLATLVILLVVLYIKLTNLRNPKHVEFAKKLHGPPTWPIIGNGFDFIGDGKGILATFTKYNEKYKSPYRLWLGSHLMVSISKAEDLAAVFTSSKLLGKPELFRYFQDFWGDSLFTGPDTILAVILICVSWNLARRCIFSKRRTTLNFGQMAPAILQQFQKNLIFLHIWKKNRKRLQPTLEASMLENYVEPFNVKINNTIKNFSQLVDKGEFDLWDYMPYLAFDIITKTALDVELDSHDKSVLQFHTCVKTGMEVSLFRMLKPWLHIKWISKLVYGKQIDHAAGSMMKFSQEAVKDKLVDIQKALNKNRGKTEEEIEADSTLSSFISLAYQIGQDANSEKLTHDEIVVMITGGTDTTGLTNSFFLLMMAIHPNIQDRVYEELYMVFGDTDRDADAEDMRKLVYLEQALKETLRRFPIVPVVFREVEQDTKIGDFIYPAGVGIIINTFAVHFNPEYYPDPWKFNPENFSPENVSRRHKNTFLAFSSGPRNCIGQGYAMLEMKLTLSAILRNYKFSTTTKMEDIKMYMGFLMSSATGYKVSITKRERKPVHTA